MTESGWLIEITGPATGVVWYLNLKGNVNDYNTAENWFQRDPHTALRFARESDARAFADWLFGKDHVYDICEHQWG